MYCRMNIMDVTLGNAMVVLRHTAETLSKSSLVDTLVQRRSKFTSWKLS